MVYTYKHKGITWIDLESPTKTEVRNLVEQVGIDPLVANELLAPTTRSRVDLHSNYIYLILHFPHKIKDHNYNNGYLHKDPTEIDFIIGKDFIITTRYSVVDAILDFSKVFESDSILDKSNIGKHAGYVFYYMIKNVYKSMYEEVQNMRDQISDYEDKVFSGKEKEMVITLSRMNRVLLYYKEALSFHKEILVSFEEAGKYIFEDEFKYYLRAVLGEYHKVQSAIESSSDYLSEIRETNDSLLSTKQNEVMKMIAIISFITFPMTLLSSIFGMNTSKTPILGVENDFWIIIGGMLIMAGFMFLFFKRKDWL